MVTIHDVAKLAGVALITVSRVINRSGYFSNETRERVEKAIHELGYVPNILARSLRSKRTNTLALILTDITNPFFTTLARGVEDTASDAGFNVIFCNTDESECEEAKYLQVLLQKQVDGFLLVPAQSQPNSIWQIRKHGEPVVVLDRCVPEVEVDMVRCDSEEGAYQLTCLLISLGRRQIAMLSGPQTVSTAADRVAGFRRALIEAGLPLDETYVMYGEFTLPSGYAMARRVLDLYPRPTAMFAANNFINVGALKAIQETGLEVPEDVALVCFDDLPPGMVVFPFFTVAAQPAYEMGRQATLLLLERLAEETEKPYQEVILPAEIIVRHSSGDPIT